MILIASIIKRMHFSATVLSKWLESVGSLLLMAIFQMVSFILLAHVIGVIGYGIIVSIASIVTIAVEFVGLGCGDLLIRDVARSKSAYRAAYGNALIMIMITLPIVCLVSVMLEHFIFKFNVSYYIIIALTFSELTSARASGLAEHVAIAHEAIRIANIYRLFAAISRMLLVVAVYFIIGLAGLEAWWPWQFAYGLIVPAIMLIDVAIRFGYPQFSKGVKNYKISFSFAGTQILRALQTNVDRIVIGHSFNAETLGTYGVAARLIQFTYLPINAVVRMTYPRYFRHGQNGIVDTQRYAQRLAPFILAIALVIVVVVLSAAGYFSAALGHGFANSRHIIEWLSPLVVLIGIQYIFADALSGADRQRLRTLLLMFGVISIAVACWYGASRYGVSGVIFANLAANTGLAAVFIIVVEILARRKRTHDARG